ncbi:DUF2336 domain-containing protein [Varunaivibrio sulfuroxidans]|uniref:Uncharacterized protein (DUF2336 family) n=1 Tax=Varunaivibrio sulfuroxidans TaxID=1773489 RepID=A0A4R3JJG0_9PROT|nr:DUF2336 domain-containing protein [Varunaivibrio sulfuroxidans]TCS65010.1 uncharacterized protein (DUF2336 family) [Varunaivibrio sulfuroxidans]WES29699.1 DUF2336 domain-containing protein [Varunaivibrio sulfuroxidans]
MIKGFLAKLRRRKPLDYDEAKGLARHKDVEIRRKLAARGDIKPEILYYLAEDPEPAVRRAIAENAAAPRQADLLLTRDDNEDVRSQLANKISSLVPGLSNDDLDKVRHVTFEVLEILARDQAVRVRQILAETLKDVANAPSEVILRLARDVEIVVSGPILEYSPVLSDADLLEIIASDPVQGALNAVSKRRLISEAVSDAIAESDDVGAIRDLLANPSAQIREQTLDSILDRAEEIEQWHRPLVQRPKLSLRAAMRLAEFVADSLLETLKTRADLDPETALAVRDEFHRRMAESTPSQDAPAKVDPLQRARDLHQNGGLTNQAMVDAIQSGDHAFVEAILAVRADIALKTVQKALSTSSVKGVIALSWKAGFPMKTAVMLQQRVAKIPPSDVLGMHSAEYPFTEDEMTWQLEFFQDLAP